MLFAPSSSALKILLPFPLHVFNGCRSKFSLHIHMFANNSVQINHSPFPSQNSPKSRRRCVFACSILDTALRFLADSTIVQGGSLLFHDSRERRFSFKNFFASNLQRKTGLRHCTEGRRGIRPHQGRIMELADHCTSHTIRQQHIHQQIPVKRRTHLQLINGLVITNQPT